MTNDQAPMTNSRERVLSVDPATDCDKWVCARAFSLFVSASFRICVANSFCGRWLHLVAAAGDPISGDITRPFCRSPRATWPENSERIASAKRQNCHSFCLILSNIGYAESFTTVISEEDNLTADERGWTRMSRPWRADGILRSAFICVHPRFHFSICSKILVFLRSDKCDVKNPRVFAKASGFPRRRQVFCATSRPSLRLADWSADVRARCMTGFSLAETPRRRGAETQRERGPARAEGHTNPCLSSGVLLMAKS